MYSNGSSLIVVYYAINRISAYLFLGTEAYSKIRMKGRKVFADVQDVGVMDTL